MSKTNLIADLLYEYHCAECDADNCLVSNYDELLQEARDAITKPWSMALKAMKGTVALHTSTAPNGGQDCHECGHSNGRHYEDCFVATLEAAIAAMEGTDEHD